MATVPQLWWMDGWPVFLFTFLCWEWGWENLSLQSHSNLHTYRGTHLTYMQCPHWSPPVVQQRHFQLTGLKEGLSSPKALTHSIQNRCCSLTETDRWVMTTCDIQTADKLKEKTSFIIFWPSACVAYTQGTVQAQILDSYSEGIRCLCYVVGWHFAGIVWVNLSLWREGHCKSIQSCVNHLHPLIKYVCLMEEDTLGRPSRII